MTTSSCMACSFVRRRWPVTSPARQRTSLLGPGVDGCGGDRCRWGRSRPWSRRLPCCRPLPSTVGDNEGGHPRRSPGRLRHRKPAGRCLPGRTRQRACRPPRPCWRPTDGPNCPRRRSRAGGARRRCGTDNRCSCGGARPAAGCSPTAPVTTRPAAPGLRCREARCRPGAAPRTSGPAGSCSSGEARTRSPAAVTTPTTARSTTLGPTPGRCCRLRRSR
jgi:hypothetical protein